METQLFFFMIQTILVLLSKNAISHFPPLKIMEIRLLRFIQSKVEFVSKMAATQVYPIEDDISPFKKRKIWPC